MTLSLRAKITLALFVTGLTSAVLVGVIARSLLLREFNQIIFDSSFDAFRGDVTAYLETYGPWDEARQIEPFPDFVERRRANVPAPTRRGVGAGSRRGGDPGPGRGATPGRGGPPPGRGGPPGDGAFFPQFFFVALDADGRVLPGPPNQPWEVGTMAPPEARADARPITVRGQVMAYVVPIGTPNMTDFDRSYLDAMQNAALWGVAGAGVLALVLGLFFSGRLSANLRTLTRAMQAMAGGALRQHVTVRSRDEVGFLADSFNRMSEDLAKSNDTIREQAGRLKELSIRDETTQLHNRRYFDEQAALAYSQAQRYARPFTVAIGDIDHFKQINDRYSHAAGDAVLRQVARLLSAGTREPDIVARYGGEEFVIAFAETAFDDAGATCERIRRQIEEHAWGEMYPGLQVTITIGVDALVTRGSVDGMLEAADARLYEGKDSGRNRVVLPAAATA